jgi:hypothetical protein
MCFKCIETRREQFVVNNSKRLSSAVVYLVDGATAMIDYIFWVLLIWTVPLFIVVTYATSSDPGSDLSLSAVILLAAASWLLALLARWLSNGIHARKGFRLGLIGFLLLVIGAFQFYIGIDANSVFPNMDEMPSAELLISQGAQILVFGFAFSAVAFSKVLREI